MRVPGWLRHPVAAVSLTWLVYGILWTQQSFAYLARRGRLGDQSWLSIARGDMLSALIWALLTPVVFFAAKVFPLRQTWLAARAVVYVILAALVSVMHAGIWQQISHPEMSLLSSQFQSTFVVGFLIFFAIAAVGHRRALGEWLRRREAAATALRIELANAQLRAAKLQAIPPVLLRSLDGIAETVRRDASLTERQLTRLADYLRVALECSDDRGITPERELALEAALVALRKTGIYSDDLTLSA